LPFCCYSRTQDDKNSLSRGGLEDISYFCCVVCGWLKEYLNIFFRVNKLNTFMEVDSAIHCNTKFIELLFKNSVPVFVLKSIHLMLFREILVNTVYSKNHTRQRNIFLVQNAESFISKAGYTP
jgi:hypothetical protein